MIHTVHNIKESLLEMFELVSQMFSLSVRVWSLAITVLLQLLVILVGLLCLCWVLLKLVSLVTIIVNVSLGFCGLFFYAHIYFTFSVYCVTHGAGTTCLYLYFCYFALWWKTELSIPFIHVLLYFWFSAYSFISSSVSRLYGLLVPFLPRLFLFVFCFSCKAKCFAAFCSFNYWAFCLKYVDCLISFVIFRYVWNSNSQS